MYLTTCPKEIEADLDCRENLQLKMSDAKLKSEPTIISSVIIMLVTFVDYITELLLQWIPITEWIQGMVFQTLEKIHTGTLFLVHSKCVFVLMYQNLLYR